MDLDDIQVFVRLARQGSFVSTAKSLGLPKSTVSDRVARLERRLGIRLVERSTRSVKLTEAGQSYFLRVERLVDELHDAEDALTAAHRAPRGVLRVGSPLLFAQAFLADVAAEYLERYPEVELELVLGDQVVDLVANNLDLAIRVGGPTDTSTVTRALTPAERTCVASASYVAVRGAPEHPRDLRHHACLVGGTSRRTTWTFEKEGARETVAVTGRYAVSALELLHRACLRGLGVALLPTFLVVEAIEQGKLVSLLPEWGTAKLTVQIVYPSRRHLSARARAFADFLVERFAAHPAASLYRRGAPRKVSAS